MSANLQEIADQWGRYPLEAFLILGEGLRQASQDLGKEELTGPERHITAGELVQGVVRVMSERYGMLAHSILRSWNIHSADDVGAITFHLIDCGILGKQDSDSPEDFHHLPSLRSQILQELERHLSQTL